MVDLFAWSKRIEGVSDACTEVWVERGFGPEANSSGQLDWNLGERSTVQIEHLEIERQQLQAARERVVALPNLEGAALAAGLRAMQGSQIEVAQKGRRQ